MRKLEANEMKRIEGGVTLSGTLLNAFTSLFKILLEAGRAVGSSIRRTSEDSVCPLK